MKDLRFNGNPFSWVGKRQKETIESSLDRVFINSNWQSMYTASELEFLPIAGSDHAPVIIDIVENVCIMRGQFRYDKGLFYYVDYDKRTIQKTLLIMFQEVGIVAEHKQIKVFNKS